MTDIRKGMPPVKLDRAEFGKRYRSGFIDPVFAPLQRELDAIVAAAWNAYSNSRKAPLTRKAGPGFSDPEYEIAVDWLAARDAVLAAQYRHDRSEHTCPGEMSKTWRMIEMAKAEFDEVGLAVDVLDLSRVTSEFGKTFILVSRVSLHPWRFATGLAVAIRTIHSVRPRIG